MGRSVFWFGEGPPGALFAGRLDIIAERAPRGVLLPGYSNTIAECWDIWGILVLSIQVGGYLISLVG